MSENLRRFLWTAYDRLGSLVGYNLLWSALSLPWIAGAYALLQVGFGLGGVGLVGAAVLAGALLLSSPATAMLFAAGAAWARGRDFGLRDFWAAGRALFWRALALGLLMVAAVALVLANVVFYQRIGGWLGVFLGGLMVWFLLLVGLVAVYVFPVLVTQEGSVWSTVRYSFLLSVDNVKLSLIFLLTAGLALGLGVASGLGLFCGGTAAWALWISVGFRALLPKYTGQPLPSEAPRRLRELIRPWEA